MSRIPNSDVQRFYRKVIRITATDSPNVVLGLEQQRRGLTPTNDVIVPGVLTWEEYQRRRITWDPIRQCIGLDAQFYEGAEVLMYPPLWLNRAEYIAQVLEGRSRQARGIGIDTGEGTSDTAMSCVDEFGLIELLSHKSKDTSGVCGESIAFIMKHRVPAGSVYIDRGGGGIWLAGQLRTKGFNVETIGFGDGLNLEPKRGLRLLEEKKEIREERYAYYNRRSEMYGLVRLLLDPANEVNPYTDAGYKITGWGLPARYTRLRHELAPIPLTYDNEGRLKLLPKHKVSKIGEDPATAYRNSQMKDSLVGLIGWSPDQADSLALAVYAMFHKVKRVVAGAI
jgi:hypothetical protein